MFATFLVPGTDTFAEVIGFDAIFVDVADKGLSFLGVNFGTESIAGIALTW